MNRTLFVAAALVAGGACGKSRAPAPGHGTMDRAAAAKLFELVELEGAPPGESDLTVDDHGTLWAIPERDRFVVAVQLDGTTKTYPLDGVPAANDTESIAWLGPNRFAIGLEGANEPTASVMFAEQRGDRFVATSTVMLSDEQCGVKLTVNHGVEGVCGHDDVVIAGIETAGTFPDGSRWAPLVRFSRDGVDLTKLRLTSGVGKISALTCTFTPDGTAHAYAIERHYGVSRILKFDVPRGAAEVTPTVALDLSAVLHDSLNLEGLARLPDGRFAAINDNQGVRAEGPTDLLLFHAGAIK
jgi:hypothetical protein